jgi:hypothetical protein
MSGISSINNSSLISSLLNSQGSNSATPGLSQISGLNADSDIVSLLGDSTDSTGSSSIYSILGGSQGDDSGNAIYNMLLSAENADLMKANPTLVKAVMAAEEAQTQTAESGTSSASSQTSSSQLLQDLQNVNLLNIDPSTLMSILQNNAASQDASSGNQLGSLINQTV